MRRPKVVLISTLVPYDAVPHAGGRYLHALVRAIDDRGDLTFIAPGRRVNRQAAVQPGAPANVLFLGLTAQDRWIGRALNRLALRIDMRVRSLDPGGPYLPWLLDLARSREARRVVREADVIDLQWSDSIRVVRLLRLLNPRAHFVGTFHDVMSEAFSRESRRTRRDRWYWDCLARRSRRHESTMVKALDEVIVFSAKDAALLGSPPHAHVVRPPLALGSEVPHQPGQQGVVLIVSYLARAENDAAAKWVLNEIWPFVHEQAPEALLRFIGGGATGDLKRLVSISPGVELAGFVTDLAGEYAAATVALVPVLHGAGVKFKTIEALLHGVPTVTTTVGAEGVAETTDVPVFAAEADDAGGLAQAIVNVLRNPGAAQTRADAAQRWAQEAFSSSRFADNVTARWPR